MKKIFSLIEHYPINISILFLLISLIYPNIQSVYAAEGQWITTGSMNNARQWHTATLLQNGKVLVAGGHNFSSAIASVELFDPSAGSWTITGSLNSVRYHHSAVLLDNGKVLVAGGQDNSSALATAELYNPDTGTWETTGAMNVARDFSVATLLPNGKVLVTGGNSGINFGYADLSSAELYDPSTGTWTYTGSMNSVRAAHTATLLPNGKVLVVGGVKYFGSYYQSLNSAELYDTDTGTWQSLASMNSDRVLHTATLLPDGKLLVTGGRTDIFYFGQYYSIITINSAEIYDPVTDIWVSTNPMSHVRANHTASLLPNGKVLVAGGLDYIDGPGFYAFSINNAEIYDSISELWQELSPLNNSRTSFRATLLQDGTLLIEGGYYESYPTHYSLTAAEYYYDNYPPSVYAGPDQSVYTLSLVALDGSGSNDPNGDPLSYQWTQTSGTPVILNDPNAVNPTFTAPGDPDTLIFSLVVTDNLGMASTPDEVAIFVNNQAPLANAGLDQSVKKLSTVTLDGNLSSDPDDDLPLIYQWTQTGGTPVILSDSTAANPTFTAARKPDTLTFSLVVTDSLGTVSESDGVVIFVDNRKNPK